MGTNAVGVYTKNAGYYFLMTPAINLLKKAGMRHVVHEYEHDPAVTTYGEETAAALGVARERLFKTLIAQIDGNELVVGVVPVSTTLDLRELAAVLGGKRAAMANPADAERATGYLTGGISPLAQKRRLRAVVDRSALEFETVYVSGGRRGMQVEILPADLVRLTGAQTAPIGR